MTALQWNATGGRNYHTGVDKGTLYVGSAPGVAWTGLTSVNESSFGGQVSSYYIDGVKYLQTVGAPDYEAMISALWYPAQFEPCIGANVINNGLIATGQPPAPFGYSYRTLIGSDINPDLGYRIHMVYNAMVEPSDIDYQTVSDETEPVAFEWKVKARPIIVPGFRPTAHWIFDSRQAGADTIASTLADILYGTESTDPRLPTVAELVDFFA